MIRRALFLLLPLALAACEQPTPPAPVASEVLIQPGNVPALTALGATVQLSATVRDQNGSPMPSASVIWTSSNAQVAEVGSASGLVTARDVGSATITAQSGGATATVNVAVDLGPANVTIHSHAWSRSSTQYVTFSAALKNSGNPGVFKLEFWSLPTSPGGSNRKTAQTEPIDVRAGWQETLAWNIPAGYGGAEWIIVLTRDQGSGAYRQTQRYELR